MSRRRLNPTCRHQHRKQRRAVITVYVVVFIVAMFGFAALAVDIGMLYATQAEMQRTADAAALAAAWDLLDEDRLKGGAYLNHVLEDAQYGAASVAEQNPILHTPAIVDPFEDVLLGYLDDPSDREAELTFVSPGLSNAAAVCVRRDAERGGSIALYFARSLGYESRDLRAEATAAFADGTVGYEVTETSGNADLLPFALHTDSWSDLLSDLVATGDDYSYDPDTGAVSSGSDGIDELNLYPGAGADQLPPGNFGTVDIGSPGNSTADIARQILEGVNAADLSYHGGQLVLGPDGTLLVNGDTGLSAGFKDELEAIKGQPRAILLFSQVSGNGNNAMYTTVGFAGIRILTVQLTGNPNDRNVTIQPAVVVDDAAITEPGPGPSYYIYRPVQLVR